MLKRLITTEELATILGTTRKAIYMKVQRGELPYIKHGTSKAAHIRFDPDEIEEYINGGRVAAHKSKEN